MKIFCQSQLKQKEGDRSLLQNYMGKYTFEILLSYSKLHTGPTKSFMLLIMHIQHIEV